jgi:competence protein ComEA
MAAMIRAALIGFMAFLHLASRGMGAEPLTKLEGCRLVPTEWADGDSFQIRTSKGHEHTLRLYGADCIEWHVTDESDARRLREQCRYFGISDIGKTVPASFELAKGFGRTAAERVATLLKAPFTACTAFADARGDGRHQRIYAFVTLADGRDLASVLVEEGLARAFGVYRETPEGKSRDEYRETMRDLELQAAKRSAGIWAKTNWEKLPGERRQQRQEEAELSLVTGKAEVPKNMVLDLNAAARDDLLKLPGVGEVMANRIIEARPYRSLEDLLEVPGIGIKTLERLRPHLVIGKSM